MAATAAAARTQAAPARRAPARRSPAPSRRARTSRTASATTLRRARAGSVPLTGRFVPVAVGRTAVAVGGLADSGIVVRLTRGRIWIGVLATLLVGIVALNVVALSFSASSSTAARQADDLEQVISERRGQLATMLSRSELEAVANKQGLGFPVPDAISYRKPSADDAATAAKRLRDGEISNAGSVAPAGVTTVDETTVAATDPALTDPAATAPAVDTAAVAPATETAPAATTPDPATAAVDPATVAPATAAPAGGVAAP
jgi:hypothetical protein